MLDRFARRVRGKVVEERGHRPAHGLLGSGGGRTCTIGVRHNAIFPLPLRLLPCAELRLAVSFAARPAGTAGTAPTSAHARLAARLVRECGIAHDRRLLVAPGATLSSGSLSPGDRPLVARRTDPSPGSKQKFETQSCSQEGAFPDEFTLRILCQSALQVTARGRSRTGPIR